MSKDSIAMGSDGRLSAFCRSTSELSCSRFTSMFLFASSTRSRFSPLAGTVSATGAPLDRAKNSSIARFSSSSAQHALLRIISRGMRFEA